MGWRRHRHHHYALHPHYPTLASSPSRAVRSPAYFCGYHTSYPHLPFVLRCFALPAVFLATPQHLLRSHAFPPPLRRESVAWRVGGVAHPRFAMSQTRQRRGGGGDGAPRTPDGGDSGGSSDGGGGGGEALGGDSGGGSLPVRLARQCWGHLVVLYVWLAVAECMG